MSVKVIDRGWKKIAAELKKANGSYVKVGYPEEKARKHKPKEKGDAIDMAQLAAIQEFGTANGRIPPRPFMADTFDANQPEVNQQIEKIKDKVFQGLITVKQGWQQLGAWYKGQIQKNMVDGVWQENAEYTIQKKGSSKPLIDTGQLRQSIDFEVVGK